MNRRYRPGTGKVDQLAVESSDNDGIDERKSADLVLEPFMSAITYLISPIFREPTNSAGAFLTYMLGLNEKYLGKYNIKSNQISGLIPVSSQVYCHSTIREELGIKEEKVINETCPLYYISQKAPPIICLLAEEDVVIEDNQLLIKKLKEAGNKDCEIKIIPNRNHMSTIMEMQNPDDPVLKEIVQFINNKVTVN